MASPKISIIMCNFNYARYLHDSLGSLTKQTSFPFECLVIDDCSTDNSVEIIKNYQKDYSFIKLIQNPQNKGVTYNINLGLKISKGDYVVFFSSDDTCSKYFIEKNKKLLCKYPNAAVSCSIPCFIKEKGDFSHAEMPPQKKLPEYISSSELIPLLKKGFFLAGHTSVIKKSCLLDACGLIPDLKWHCDWFALITIGLRHGICFIPENLAFLRIVPKSYSSSFLIWKNQKKVLKSLNQILQKKEFLDVKEKFFISQSILYLPYACIYFVTHPKYWFTLSWKIWRQIINILFYKNLLKKNFLIKPIKKLLMR